MNINRLSPGSFLLIILSFALLVYFFFLINDKEQKTGTEETSLSLTDQTVYDLDPEKTYLFDISGGEGFGLAQRAFSDGKFIETIDASLSDLGPGECYSAWLVSPNENGEETYLPIGELSRVADNYFLVYQSDKDLRKISKVIVTKGGLTDIDPGQGVLEGEFRQR